MPLRSGLEGIRNFVHFDATLDIRRGFRGTAIAPACRMDRAELEARSMRFAVQVKTLCDEMRQQPIAWKTAGQLLDAATSMAANYRATSRARSKAEWVSKIGVVAEEADESVFWLEFASTSGLVSVERVTRLLGEAKELRAIFAASAATSRENRRRGKGRRKQEQDDEPDDR